MKDVFYKVGGYYKISGKESILRLVVYDDNNSIEFLNLLTNQITINNDRLQKLDFGEKHIENIKDEYKDLGICFAQCAFPINRNESSKEMELEHLGFIVYKKEEEASVRAKCNEIREQIQNEFTPKTKHNHTAGEHKRKELNLITLVDELLEKIEYYLGALSEKERDAIVCKMFSL